MRLDKVHIKTMRESLYKFPLKCCGGNWTDWIWIGWFRLETTTWGENLYVSIQFTHIFSASCFNMTMKLKPWDCKSFACGVQMLVILGSGTKQISLLIWKQNLLICFDCLAKIHKMMFVSRKLFTSIIWLSKNKNPKFKLL